VPLKILNYVVNIVSESTADCGSMYTVEVLGKYTVNEVGGEGRG
jgi:hypothetical protein